MEIQFKSPTNAHCICYYGSPRNRVAHCKEGFLVPNRSALFHMRRRPKFNNSGLRHSFAKTLRLSRSHTLKSIFQQDTFGRRNLNWNSSCRAASIEASTAFEEGREEENEDTEASSILKSWNPPRYIWRALAAWVIAGQVIVRLVKGRVHWRNALQQLELVGPRSAGVCLLTAAFVGMAFTIQFVREFTRLGLTRSVGGVLGLALSRELSPVVTAIIIAGRVGSAFAAELGTMQVSEQTDTLRVLGTDPVDYLIVPRVFACCVALPILTLICFSVAMAASVLLADAVYNVSANIILDSARRALYPWDIVSAMVKSTVFGGLISVVSCSWGVTTLGGAKGVGESTTSAVVISLVCIFIADFVLSWCFFQGAGDALKAAMG
eukprot:TRINITY_DN35464_c0_g1_i1.p1 TRINITY_DN35464_c0_g1~~TRINITY_DN35464_c0_g1_i1.p1  ORF type:complete len:379 (+),score=30.43 TRINITY_DN35464_c0_g1_i1:287-1423(+)